MAFSYGWDAFASSIGSGVGVTAARSLLDSFASAARPKSPCIIAVPHAGCQRSGHVRTCDLHAEKFSRALVMPGDEVLLGKVGLHRGDLNHPASEGTGFHRSLNRLLGSGAYSCVIDAHSFDPRGLPKERAQSDVVLAVGRNPESAALADEIARCLVEGGYRVTIFQAANEVWTLAKAERSGTPAVLIDVNEKVDESQLSDIAACVNAARHEFFAPNRVTTSEDGSPPVPNPLATIKSITYRCDGLTQVGLCPVSPSGKRFEHTFAMNAPSLDTVNGNIHGKIAYNPTGPILGIGDWPGQVGLAEFVNSSQPRYRIGTLEYVTLKNGMPWGFGNHRAGLFVDSSMQRLFVVMENPAAPHQVSGVEKIESVEAFERHVGGERFAAVLFLSATCPHCAELKPHLPAVCDLFPNLKVVDCTDEGMMDLAVEQQISDLPCLAIYVDGERVDCVSGNAALEEAVEA